MGDAGYGIDPKVIDDLAEQIKEIVEDGVQVAITVGGGNIFRGVAGSADGMDRAQADYIGMLATVMNSLALQDGLERHGVSSRVQSAIEMHQVAETYIRLARHSPHGKRPRRHLRRRHGQPVFHHRHHGSSRACEINADCMMKATKVDGIYDSDPKANPDAKKFDKISYLDVLTKELNVMDAAAISLCKDNAMPLLVFNMTEPGNIARVLKGRRSATLVY